VFSNSLCRETPKKTHKKKSSKKSRYGPPRAHMHKYNQWNRRKELARSCQIQPGRTSTNTTRGWGPISKRHWLGSRQQKTEGKGGFRPQAVWQEEKEKAKRRLPTTDRQSGRMKRRKAKRRLPTTEGKGGFRSKARIHASAFAGAPLRAPLSCGGGFGAAVVGRRASH
jgi:hypothetical protein